MELIDVPFLKFSPDDLPRPWLPLAIKNPHTNQSINVYGLIDTGADECAIPAHYAPLIGHNLQAGVKHFLSDFILTVDYKRSVFSLKRR